MGMAERGTGGRYAGQGTASIKGVCGAGRRVIHHAHDRKYSSAAAGNVTMACDTATRHVKARHSILSITAAILAGLSVPLLATGPTPTLIALVLSVALFLAAPGRAAVLKAWAASAKSPLGIAFGICLALLLPSAIASIESVDSFSILGRVILLVLVAGLLCQFLRRDNGAREYAFRALVTASVFFAVIALLGLHVYAPIYTLFRGTLAETPQPTQLLKGYASAVGCLIPVVVWASIQLDGRWRYLGLIYVPLALLLLVGSNSRAGLVGVIAAAFIGGTTLLLLRIPGLGRRGLGVFFIAMAVIALGALAFVFSRLPEPPPLDQLTGPTYDLPVESTLPLWLVDAHRQQIWGFALNAVQASPVVGHGIDTSNYVPGASTVMSQFQQAFVPAHPHNWVLEIFMDTGALGFLGLVSALATLVWLWVRNALTSPLTASCGLALFAAFWTSSLFNFSVWLTWWQGVFLLLTAILIAGGVQRRGTIAGDNIKSERK